MSASLPFFFAPALLKNGKTASYIVDGALISNFPIWLFQKENLPTFGFHFQTDHQPQKANNLLEYIQAIILTTISGLDKEIYNSREKYTAYCCSHLGYIYSGFRLDSWPEKAPLRGWESCRPRILSQIKVLFLGMKHKICSSGIRWYSTSERRALMSKTEKEQKKVEQQEVKENIGEVKQESRSCPGGTLYTIRRGDTFSSLPAGSAPL